jgi:hypothetical protein
MGLSAFPIVQVQGQEAPDKSAKEMPPLLAELQGVTINAAVVHQQVLKRDDKQFPQQSRFDLRLSIKGDRIEGTISPSGHGPRGPYQGKVQPVSATLDKPQASKNFGGGNGIWFVNESGLTNVLVFRGGGAFRREITFTHADGGLACTIKETFARENGAGPITWRASADGLPLTLISDRQVSSSCRVKKG